MSTPVWVGYAVIAASISAVVVWMISANSGPPDEKRYCLKCGKTTGWNPNKGCTECDWADNR